MNWLDVVLLLLLLLSVITALSKGLTREIVGLSSAVAALLLGLWLYGSVGALLRPYLSRSMANFCGFLVVFCGVLTLGALLGFLLGKLLQATGLSFLDRLLGVAFGVARGLLLAVALLTAILAFAPDPAKPPRAVVHSRFAPYVIDAARVCAAMAPYELKEGFRKSYEEVRNTWNKTLHKGIRDLRNRDKAEHEREI